MVTPLTIQRAALRFTALVLFTGLPGALLPGPAAVKFSWLMGLGQPPLGPLQVYLSGNAGFVYVVLGVLVWMLARDPRRYRPLVAALAVILLAGGPAYLSIDLQAGLPLWWVLLDSVACLAVGGVLLGALLADRPPSPGGGGPPPG